MCRWADDNAVHAPREALPGEVWDRSVLLGFSARQNAERDRWNKNLLGLDWIPRNAPDPGPWLPARDLAGQRVWVSADAVLLDYSNRDTGVPRALADTNGAAAGATDRQAQSLALLELIERDATGRWWYGQRSRSGLDISRLSDVGKDLLQALESRGLTVRLFDITTDLCVPVVAAVCADKNASPVSVGFAAAPEFANAAMKALCEMAQMRLLFELKGSRLGLSRWKDEVSLDTAPLSHKIPGGPRNTEFENSRIAERLKEAGVRIAFVNRTRPEFNVPVWRAISPDLCHWKPRFGRKRLLARDECDLGSPPTEYNPTLLRI